MSLRVKVTCFQRIARFVYKFRTTARPGAYYVLCIEMIIGASDELSAAVDVALGAFDIFDL